MSFKRIVSAINWLLLAIVVTTPLFFWKWSLYPYTVPKTILFEILVELVFALWLALAISDRRYRPSTLSPLVWAVVGYLALLTITAFTGVDPWRSFFSDLQRTFGIVLYYHLAALALVASSFYREIPWKKLWYTSFGVALFSVGIALIQIKVPDLILTGDSSGGRPGALFGNPTFFAGYLLFNIFLAGYYLLSPVSAGENKAPKQNSEKIFLWATVLAGIIGIFITATRGDILGLFGGVIALVILFAFRPPTVSVRLFSRRSFYGLLIAILVIAAGGVWFTRNSAIWDHVPGIDRLKNLTISGSNSDIAPRLMALNASWQGFVERPFTGWGLENFNVVFNKYYDPKVLEYGYAESDFDKPHDIVMEQLDAGGILLLLVYLGVLVALVYEAWKLRERLLGQFVFAIVVAYFIRSLVIFDTLGPALMLYMLIGWVDGAWRGERRITEGAGAKQAAKGAGVPRSALSGPVVASALIGAVIVAYLLNGTVFAASSLAWQGHIDLQLTNNPSGGLAAFRDDVATWNVYQWDFIRDEANTVAQAYFYDESTVPKADVQNGIALMQQVALDHPNDAYNHYVLTDIYNLAYDIDSKDYLQQAEQQAQLALALSPNRQEIYFYLSKTKSLEGDNAGALAAAKTALDLDPNVPDANFYYGMLAFANGDRTTGYNAVKAALAMGRKWTNYHEPEVAGDFFADAGHLTEAIGFYQAAFSLDPTDYSAEAKLGAAYYLTKDNVSAKKYLSDAAAHINFTTSPAYVQYKPILDALGIGQ